MSDPLRHQPMTAPQMRTDPQDAELQQQPPPGNVATTAQLDAVGRLAHLYKAFERGQGSAADAPAADTPAADAPAVDAPAAEGAESPTETWRRLYAPVPAPEVPPVDVQASSPPAPAGTASPLVRRLLKTALGLGIVAVVGYAPLQRLLQTSSVEAVVNARMITLRAPIDGEVEPGSTPLDFGTVLAPGQVLFRIVNRRADRSRVDDLTRQIEQLEGERPSIAARLSAARALLKDLTEQTRLFAEARILQLEARQGELIAEVAAAQAKREAAKIVLDRDTELAGRGVRSMSQLTQSQREDSVTEKQTAAAEKRLEALAVELSAARRGVFVGDSYNDRPRSSQRADELSQQVSNLAATLAETDQRITRLTGELADEKAYFSNFVTADMVAPTTGSVWEMLTAPQEQVHRGQELVRVLDCAGAVVTAVVSEAAYNRLQVGSSARFQLRDRQEELPGRVIRLTGASASPANLAIQPSVLLREGYHVTVAVPKLAEGRGCMVGRTGRVIFDDGPVAPPAAGPDVP
jgi:multidrug resistance efflux pump